MPHKPNTYYLALWPLSFILILMEMITNKKQTLELAVKFEIWVNLKRGKRTY